jgi:hypothetical protein
MSTAIYRLLLRLYPSEIRGRWEEELVETFALQLADGWLGAWRCAVAELFRIALPLQVAREGMVIPIVSLASSGALFFGLLWALGNSLALLSLYHRLLDNLGG